jgi:hypothetical protein
MSLINDALKRASKPRSPEPDPTGAFPMRAVDRPPVKALPKFFLPVALIVFAASVWILAKGLQTQQAMYSAAGSIPVAAREGEPPLPPAELLTKIAKEHPDFRPIADKILRNELTPAKPQVPLTFTTPEAPPPPPHIVSPTTPARVTSPSGSPPNPVPPPQPTVQPQARLAPVSQPAYKLGGIFYRLSSPAAVVNNKTVYVGDRVDKARVRSIQKDAVVLELPDGKTLELLLE